MSFDYAQYYRRLQDLKLLQMPAQAVSWTERYETPARRADVVLYLGCNILRTPDVAADVVAVFTALGLDFVAVAGVQFCCGITWDRHDEVAKGQAVSVTTIDRLQSYEPSLVVHWCPSCDVHFSDVITGRDAQSLPFDVISAAALLARMARAGEISWQRAVPARAVVHGHTGRAGHLSGKRRAREDTEQIGELLRRLPGVEYLGSVDAPPELDYDCGPSVPGLERSIWRSVRAGLWEELRATGADHVVTKSHACQREWSDLSSEAVRVRCYISLVADALGCPRDYASNPLTGLKHAGRPEAVVQLTRTNWASHGITESEAREVAGRYDWSDDATGRLPP
ncbi:MAG: (Fe-S)-binding protein [Gemmatimonadota bacterium]